MISIISVLCCGTCIAAAIYFFVDKKKDSGRRRRRQNNEVVPVSGNEAVPVSGDHHCATCSALRRHCSNKCGVISVAQSVDYHTGLSNDNSPPPYTNYFTTPPYTGLDEKPPAYSNLGYEASPAGNVPSDAAPAYTATADTPVDASSSSSAVTVEEVAASVASDGNAAAATTPAATNAAPSVPSSQQIGMTPDDSAKSESKMAQAPADVMSDA